MMEAKCVIIICCIMIPVTDPASVLGMYIFFNYFYIFAACTKVFYSPC